MIKGIRDTPYVHSSQNCRHRSMQIHSDKLCVYCVAVFFHFLNKHVIHIEDCAISKPIWLLHQTFWKFWVITLKIFLNKAVLTWQIPTFFHRGQFFVSRLTGELTEILRKFILNVDFCMEFIYKIFFWIKWKWLKNKIRKYCYDTDLVNRMYLW